MPHRGRSCSVWLRMMVNCLSSAMPCRKIGAAADVGADGLVHERNQGVPAFLRGLVNADDDACRRPAGLPRSRPEMSRTVNSIVYAGRRPRFGSGARSEHGAAKPYHSRSFFHRHFKIAAHAHAQMGQGRAQKVLALLSSIRAAAGKRAGPFPPPARRARPSSAHAFRFWAAR